MAAGAAFVEVTGVLVGAAGGAGGGDVGTGGTCLCGVGGGTEFRVELLPSDLECLLLLPFILSIL